jgi:hypothetical protein
MGIRERNMRYVSYFQLTALSLILVCIISSSNAIVLHPDSGQPAEKPADAVIGRWSYNASFVVIGLPENNTANAIITTRHQGTTPASVVIDGTTYDLGTIYNSPDNSDIQIAELVGANLANYVPIYTLENPNNPTQNETGEDVVLGGYGKGRGDPVYDDQEQDIIGYKWGGNDNETLRWGTNIIDGTATVNGLEQLVTDFDGPSATGTTTYEAAIAEYDSGSGWFINKGGQWYLAGLTYATSNEEKQSLFDPPDDNYAHRLSEPEIATWINTTLETIPEPATVLIFTLGSWLALRKRTI